MVKVPNKLRVYAARWDGTQVVKQSGRITLVTTSCVVLRGRGTANNYTGLRCRVTGHAEVLPC